MTLHTSVYRRVLNPNEMRSGCLLVRSVLSRLVTNDPRYRGEGTGPQQLVLIAFPVQAMTKPDTPYFDLS